MSTAELSRAVDRLVAQVAHWQAGRWAADLPGGPVQPGGGPVISRADRVYALAQRLADLSADACREPRRTVPRLADLVLPDQIRVLTDEVLQSGAPQRTVALAAEDVDLVRRGL